MNRVIYLLLPGLLFAASAAAQPGPPRKGDAWGPPSSAERAERLSKDLGLNEDQQAKLLEIFSASEQERDEMRARHEEEIRQDVCALFNSVTEQIKGVLTEQQSAEFDDLVARKKAHIEGHHRHHGRDGMPPMDCQTDGAGA